MLTGPQLSSHIKSQGVQTQPSFKHFCTYTSYLWHCTFHIPSVSKSTTRFWKISICDECVIVLIEGVPPLLRMYAIAWDPTYSTNAFMRGMLYLCPGSCDTWRWPLSSDKKVTGLRVLMYESTSWMRNNKTGEKINHLLSVCLIINPSLKCSSRLFQHWQSNKFTNLYSTIILYN